jgi:hypothetical protein
MPFEEGATMTAIIISTCALALSICSLVILKWEFKMDKLNKEIEAQIEVQEFNLGKRTTRNLTYCPDCLANGEVVKLQHEAGCVQCHCGFSACG